MSEQRVNGHTVIRFCLVMFKKSAEDFWSMSVIAEGVNILKGVVGKDHVHMHLEYRPSQSVSGLVKKLKGRSSRRLQDEFPELNKRYWGRHFWAIGFGRWSTGNITDKMVNEYLEHHRKSDNDTDAFILE